MGLFGTGQNKKAQGPVRSEALECIPVKFELVEESRSESGELLLSYPVTIRPWLAGLTRRMGGKRKGTVLRKLQLDSLGTEVWDLMDGKVRVGDIVRRFASTHKIPRREAEMAVTRFLRDLGRRGLIGLR